MPPDNFASYIYNLEHEFCNRLPILANASNVGVTLKNELMVHELPHPCANFPKKVLVSLYVRLRIYYIIKYINQDLANFKCNTNYKLKVVKHL